MSFNDLLKVRVEAWSDGKKIADLKLDDLDFVWNHPSINLSGNYENGQKGAIIEMFGWPYEEIAK
jgi:alpha-amylase